MQAERPVALVILTWNALDFTKRCLEALNSVTDHSSYRVIVVDNGSTDGTVEYLRDLSWVELIENGENLGFTKGCNIGIRAAGPDTDVLLMNNDIIVNDPGWLKSLQEVAYSADDVGIVGTRLVEPSGRLNHTGSFMPPITLYGQQMGGGELDVGQYRRVREIECTVFAVAYIRRDCIDQVGLLDEDFFAYFEDTEYCLRASKAGRKTLYAGMVSPLHYHNTTTRENKVDFWKMYLGSRDVFRSKWGNWLENERYDATAVWHSVLHQPLGYALHSRKMMASLHFAGVKLAYRNAYGQKDPHTEDYLIEDIRKRKPSKSDVQIAYCMAEAFPKVTGRKRIGWTMLEVTGLPREWVDGCNTMDEVWVPASFNVETFKNSGVTVPIRVMPLGVDLDHFNPAIAGFRPTDKYTFLSVFEWGERKAPEVLLRAFAEEFKPSEDAVLMLSVFNRDPTIDVRVEIARLELPESAPIIVMVNPEFADYQMGALYRSADCFVLPTRGEGWGMPALEAMACGVPVIATSWSGQADFLDEKVGYPIDYKMIPAVARCPYYEGFDWAEPDVEHLKSLLRHVYEHPDEARAKGHLGWERARDQFSWELAAERVKNRLLEIA